MTTRELPRPEDLRDYNYAVAGHAGTMCDADGEFFIKPCTQTEIDFYNSISQPVDGKRSKKLKYNLDDIIPLFMGTLTLTDSLSGGLDEALAGVISEDGTLQTTKEHIVASVTERNANAFAEASPADEATWVPSKGKKIKTDQAVVLENITHGFQRANILDVKLGMRLWADDAPQQKKDRFTRISAETTHGSLGFRIAGMRVYRGSEDASELDDEGYKIYDKEYGRVSVNKDNVIEEFKRFIFNKGANITKDMGEKVCAAFAKDLQNVHDVLSNYETRMYSTSLLFVFEGDGDALQKAFDENEAFFEKAERRASYLQTTRRIDSGIGLDDDEELYDSDLDELVASVPKIYSLKLIDFAHASWTPGQGPDENILTGVRSLKHIFDQMADE
ncbi:hypothetical protein C2857_004217 [Epichloe festucae Fl1]|uniref:Kinase n=1 Tax=Epichloe festucae (strain Fl1) TaxID=877507 RepID=A0A7U3Q282_EPIFF|nr:hypothetical protein C2857_004217 [Epichloe festucae Fl1]